MIDKNATTEVGLEGRWWPNAPSRENGEPRSLADLAWERARNSPDRIAFYFDDGSAASYAAVADEALALIRAMSALGLTKGDVVSFQLPNWREAAAISIAASALGLILNPVTPIYRDNELRFILRDARTRMILIPGLYRSTDYPAMLDALAPSLPDLRHIVVLRSGADEARLGVLRYEALVAEHWNSEPVPLPAMSSDATKLIMYTSGTTGSPKGVVHTTRTIAASHDDYSRTWNVSDGDVMLMPSPVTHGTGFILGIEIAYYTAATTVFMERWDAGRAISLINSHSVSLCASATIFLKDLIDVAAAQGEKLPTLRLFCCGGASVPAALIYRVDEATERCRAVRVYGLTEAPLITKGFLDENDPLLAAETDGQISGYHVKVVDMAGAVVTDGQEGEILVKGAPLMVGYANSADNDSAFDEEGYFRTGDLGHLTPENGIVITGRRKDLIIRGGENLSAKEIEDAIEQHPAISEAAAVAMPHSRFGETVCAFIKPHADMKAPSLEELVAMLERQGLARQKFPERLEVIHIFPRTASGKIRKDLLRDRLRVPDDQKA